MKTLVSTRSSIARACGLQRVDPAAYAAMAATAEPAELDAWVPDGRPGGTNDWYLFFAGLNAEIASEVNNAAR
jgi:hypothetical protein